MSSRIDEIRKFGHWRIMTRPDEFVEERIPNITELAGVVDRAAVRVTGWAYPITEPGIAVDFGTDWVEFGVHQDPHNEVWRMHQSGQFLHYLAFWDDGASQRSRRAPDGKALEIMEVARVFSHVFRFASRLGLHECFADKAIAIRIDAQGLEGRQLYIEPMERGEFHSPQVASLPSFPFETVMDTEQLKNQHDELAAKGAIELFRRFGWDPTLDIVLGMMPPRP